MIFTVKLDPEMPRVSVGQQVLIVKYPKTEVGYAEVIYEEEGSATVKLPDDVFLVKKESRYISSRTANCHDTEIFLISGDSQ